MANPRPLKLTNAAFLQTLKKAILEQNRLEFQKKFKFWPSKWRFFKNVALEPIWVGHGWVIRLNKILRFYRFTPKTTHCFVSPFRFTILFHGMLLFNFIDNSGTFTESKQFTEKKVPGPFKQILVNHYIIKN
jgi:hypothetical protein